MNRLFLRKSVIKPEKCNQFQGSEKSEIERRKLNVEPIEFSTEKKKNGSDFSLPFNGGGHGTRTHGAVTPYLISNQAP